MFDDDLVKLATDTLATARQRGWKIVTAESCTGGLIAGLLTEIPGSSDVLDRGFVTYSNAAKRAHLGVPADILERDGAVSEAVVRAMVTGALAASGADLAVAVTGVAGPGGGSSQKPVGTVHMAAALAAAADAAPRVVHVRQDYGDLGRSEVRRVTVRDALGLVRSLTESA